jgi:hypothetical protein
MFEYWEFLMRRQKSVMTFIASLLLVGISASVSAKESPSELEYLAVFMDGKKVGYSTHSRKVESGRVSNSEMMMMTIKRSGVAITVKVTETYYETPQGEPLGFVSEQNFGTMGMKVEGVRNKQGSFDVTINAGGMTQKQNLAWPEGALMAEGVQLLSMKKGLKEGTEFSAKIFMPMMMQAIVTDVRVGATKQVDLLGRVVELTEVIMTMKMSGTEFTSTNYVDQDFGIQKMLMPMSGLNLVLELMACSKEFALSENDVLDFIDKMIIASPIPLNDIKSTDSLTYHLAPKGDYQLQLPTGDNQKVRKDNQGGLLVTVKPMAVPEGNGFPYRGKDKTALQALEPTRFLQSDSPKIIALAKKAVGDTKDAGVAVRRIESFVHEHISEKNLSVGYASAVEVAASGQGDCSEHAVLTAAMCRALGIPARVAVGYVYVDEFGDRKNVFGGHAWTEAFIGGKWIGLDATRAPNGYSAGHITQATGNGNPEDFFSLVSQAKHFKIVKIEKNN